MEESVIEEKALSSRPGIRPPLLSVPPFEVPWEFYTTMPSDTPTYDYYSFLAFFQYWDGWTEGQFSAGLGDVPLPEDAPVVSWGWRHRLDAFPRGGHFRAKYQIGNGDVIFSGDEGYDPGSTLSIWASILQLRARDDVVIDGVVLPIPSSYAGRYELEFEAKTHGLHGRDYWIWVGWVAQIRYHDSQRGSLILGSRIVDFQSYLPTTISTKLEKAGGDILPALQGHDPDASRVWKGERRQGKTERFDVIPHRGSKA